MANKVLFVCTANIDRSPTAEDLLNGKNCFEVLSAGTWANARKSISESLIDWADLILVMKECHKEAVLTLKPKSEKKIIVLDIPDIYLRDDPKLVKLLKTKLSDYLNIKW
jgi:predicted protein tyrosine phosphatase